MGHSTLVVPAGPTPLRARQNNMAAIGSPSRQDRLFYVLLG
jgi:hypothetical protein